MTQTCADAAPVGDTGRVDVTDLDRDPVRQLANWIADARAAGELMPEAMCLATSGAEGMPSARFVLMRGLDDGVVFFTDYGSDKARDLRDNPRAAAVFHFSAPVHRQVRVSGSVAKTGAEESDRYWATRPVASRRSAIASHQSSVITTRRELEAAVAAVGDAPEPVRPERWGGYRIHPEVVEFWEEGQDRLHDRLRFRRDHEGWRLERLSP
jgi:pyridoxamine 5'-phosphate oxidase